jgi:hypothetical protein
MNKSSKCYKCNPDRGSDCGYGWVWSSGFSEGNAGWWYKEVPCGGSSSDGCPVNSFLPKKGVLEKDSEYAREDVSYEVWKNKTQAHPETRRYLFAPKRDKTTTYNDYFELKGSSVTQCYKNSKKEWVCENDSQLSVLKKDADGYECGKKGVDYGIIEPDGSNHELGHKIYNECVEFYDTSLSFSECICETEVEKKAEKEKENLRVKVVNENKKLLNNRELLFHNTYGKTGYATSYKCPN